MNHNSRSRTFPTYVSRYHCSCSLMSVEGSWYLIHFCCVFVDQNAWSSVWTSLPLGEELLTSANCSNQAWRFSSWQIGSCLDHSSKKGQIWLELRMISRKLFYKLFCSSFILIHKNQFLGKNCYEYILCLFDVIIGLHKQLSSVTLKQCQTAEKRRFKWFKFRLEDTENVSSWWSWGLDTFWFKVTTIRFQALSWACCSAW